MKKALLSIRRLLIPLLFTGAGFVQHATAQNCTVNAGIPQTICIQNPLVLTGTENGLFTGGNNYRWDKISGPSAVITNTTAASTGVTNLSAGVYTFRLSALCQDGVRANNDVQVTVVKDVTLPDAGPDQTVCVANTANPLQLAANAPAAGETAFWTAIPSTNAVFSSVSSPTATFKGDPGTVYTLVWTIKNAYCIRTDTAIVSLTAGNAVVDAGVSKVLNCNGSSASLSGSNPGLPPQSGLWSIVSGPAGATFSNATSAGTSINNLVPGTYILKWEVSGPCVSGWDTMQIVVQNTNSSPNTGGSTSLAPFCSGQGNTSVVLTAPSPAANVVSMAWTQLSGPTTATLSTPNSNSTTVSGLNGTGTYVFRYSASNGGCSSSSNYTFVYAQEVTNLPDIAPQSLPCGATSTTVPVSYSYGGSTNSTGLSRSATILSQPTGANASATLSQSTPGNEQWSVQNMTKTGQYVVRFTWSTPCGSASREATFYTSFPAGAVNAGSDPVIPCNVMQTNMSGNPPPAPVVGTWSQVSGPNQANITQPNNPGSLMSGLIPGTYVFRWQLSSGDACLAPSDDAVAVVSSASVVAAAAGPDRTDCNVFPVKLSGNMPGPTQKGLWTVIPAAGTIADPTSPVTTVTGLAANTTYKFVWKIYNVCASSTDTIKITTGNSGTQIIPNAGADQCKPSGTTSFPLAGSAPGVTLPKWIALDGGTIANANNQNTTVTVSGNGSYRFVYQLTYPGCDTATDTMVVQISPAATVANAGPDQSICMSGVPATANLSGNTPTQGTPVWSLINGLTSAVIGNPNTPNTTATNLYPGVYFFEYKIDNGICAASRDTVRLNLGVPPSQAVASTSTPSFCNANSGNIVLSAVAPTVGTGTWTVLSAPPYAPGSIVINNAATPNATVDVSNLVTGTYKFRYTVSNGTTCASSVDSVTVSVIRPASSIGTSTVNLCNVSVTQLNGAPNTNGTWSVTSIPSGAPTPTISAISGFQATASNLVQGSYVFTYSIPAVGSCPASSVNRTYVNGIPASVAGAGPDQFLCSGVSTVTLNGTTSVGGGSWSFVSGPSGGNAGVANNNYTDTTIINLSQGVYAFRYTTKGTGSCPTESATVQVVREKKADAGVDKAICGGPYSSLSGNVPAYYAAQWTQLSGPNTATIANAAAPNTGLTGLVSGTYTFRYEIGGPSGCAINDDTVVVQVDAPITYNAGPDTSLCIGAPAFTIGTPAVSGVTYSWTPVNNRISAANIAQPTFTPSVEGTYTYLVKATRGACQAQDDITVIVKPEAIAPTFNIPAPACGNGPATISISNADPLAIYTWSGGYGTGTSKTVVPGTYTVSVVRDGCAGPSGSATLNYKPIPDSPAFTVPAPACGTGPATVSINNADAGATYTWSGGYGTGTSKSVAPGTYTVSVTKNGCAGPSGTFTLGYKPIPATPTFNVPASACGNGPATVSITNIDTAATYTWSGGYGNGTTKTVAPGTYTVSVSKNGCAGTTGTFTLGFKPAPSAAFTKDTVCRPSFTVTTPTAGATYAWNFGAGATPATYTGTTANQGPIHYNPMGSKTVTLIVTAANGCADTASHTFQALCAPPVAAFTASKDTVCLGMGISFTNQTTVGDTPIVYTYNFGDGSPVVTGANASHTYAAPGTYTVTFTATNTSGTNSATKTITVKPLPVTPTFSVPAPACGNGPALVSITNADTNAIYTWSGGYGTGTSKSVVPGTYTVTPMLNGCTTTPGTFTLNYKPIPDSPAFNVPAPACGNGPVTVSISNPTPGATYTWSGGLGTGITKTVTPGTYTVSVDLNGCAGPSGTFTVTFRTIPVAVFTQDQFCHPTFTVTNPEAGATYNWNFGAGATPATYSGPVANQGPITYVPSSGTRTVSLVMVSANGCADTASKTFNVSCIPPVAAFAVSSSNICLGSAISFTNTTTVGDTPFVYSYNFGDGSPVVNTPNATYTYTTPGTYTASFTVTGPAGSNTATQTIVVRPIPNTNFIINQNPQGLTGNLFTFNALGPATNLYDWDFGDGSIGQYATVSRSYAAVGSYPVTLKVTDVVNGCVAYRTQVVTVVSDSVSSGGTGGIESESLGGLVTRRDFNRLKLSLNTPIAYPALPLFEQRSLSSLAKGTGTQELSDMIPANLYPGYVPRVSTPADLTALTIAREVMAVDYTLQNVNKAVVLGIKTDDRAYNHTKSICDRFRGATLLHIEPVTLRGMTFPRFALLRENGLLEYAIAFGAGRTPGIEKYRIQSDWVIASYAKDKAVYNFQVWATTPADVEKLALDVLDKQASALPLERYNSGVTVPDVYVTKGIRHKDTLLLTVRNKGVATSAVMDFKVQSKEDGGYTDMKVSLNLQAQKDTTIGLPIGDGYEYEGLMRAGDTLVDQFYLADGNWGLDYDKSQTSVKTYVPDNDPTRVYTDNSFPLYRKVDLKAVSTDYITLYKSIKPGTEPTDLTPYQSLKFHAAGKGKAEIRITRAGITKWDEQYKTVIELTEAGKDYAISFDDFVSDKQGVAFSAKDAKTVSFTLAAPAGKTAALNLSVSGAEFSKEKVTSARAFASRSIQVTPNPTKGPFKVTFASDASRALTLTVTDLTGRVILEKAVDATLGNNVVEVRPEVALPAGTILLVDLRNGDVRYEATKVTVQ